MQHLLPKRLRICGKPWYTLARSLLARLRPPTIPVLRRIPGLSVMQPPAREISKSRCRHRKPRDNLPMRFRRLRATCGADDAMRGKPAMIIRYGERQAVIVSCEEWEQP